VDGGWQCCLFKRKLLLVPFSLPWMEGMTWYLEGPLKQAVSLSVYCVVSVVVKNQTNLGPTESWSVYVLLSIYMS